MNSTQVRDVMTKDVVTVRSFASFRQITAVMLNRGIGALPVVDSMGHVIGVVSRTDLIAKAAAAQGRFEAWELLSRRGRQARDHAAATNAARLMATRTVTVGADADIARAAYLMERHAVTHLPVVDAHNLVVGIVSRGDLLSGYLRDDGEIRLDVLHAIAQSALGAEAGAVDAQVEDGIVTLSGTVDYSPAAARAIDDVRAVQGVVDVVDTLDWRRYHALPAEVSGPGPLF